MSEHSSTICPWCQMEIVWDEELGPEEACPHCFNELNDYRSLHVHLDGDDLKLSADGDDDDLTELSGYALSVRQRLEQQENVLECVRCQDEMVLAGSLRVEEGMFTPFVPSGQAPAFIKTPFRVDTYVCPSCFQVSSALSDEDKVRLVNEWSKTED